MFNSHLARVSFWLSLASLSGFALGSLVYSREEGPVGATRPPAIRCSRLEVGKSGGQQLFIGSTSAEEHDYAVILMAQGGAMTELVGADGGSVFQDSAAGKATGGARWMLETWDTHGVAGTDGSFQISEVREQGKPARTTLRCSKDGPSLVIAVDGEPLVQLP